MRGAGLAIVKAAGLANEGRACIASKARPKSEPLRNTDHKLTLLQTELERKETCSHLISDGWEGKGRSISKSRGKNKFSSWSLYIFVSTPSIAELLF